jgi:hypothetical protein
VHTGSGADFRAPGHFDDGRRTSDGAARAVECGDEVSGSGRDLTATAPRHLTFEQTAQVDEIVAFRSRTDRHDRREHQTHGRACMRARDERLDLVQNGVLIAHEWQVIVPLELDERRAPNV